MCLLRDGEEVATRKLVRGEMGEFTDPRGDGIWSRLYL